MSEGSKRTFPQLAAAAFECPAIDNHAHPLLRAQHRSQVPFEGLVSEAQGPALIEDAPTTLACYRATKELAKLLGLPSSASWDDVKAARDKLDYAQLVELSMRPTRIQCILLDDGLGGVQEMCESIEWHDSYTLSPTKRIVRVEIIAQDILKDVFNGQGSELKGLSAKVGLDNVFRDFEAEFVQSITFSAQHANVAGFKSIACYRGGLDVAVSSDMSDVLLALETVVSRYLTSTTVRLADKALNDWIVQTTCCIAAQFNKPIQFHTGLGDNDIPLARSSPAHLQPLIAANPRTTFILLHSSYPYTRDAGYLAAVYQNAYLDFGEIFPFVSAEGQRSVIRQMLELCPTSKIMWSTDGHWWPESFFLGTKQAREALYEVLADYVTRGEMTESEAVGVVHRALFLNANRVYQLGLKLHS